MQFSTLPGHSASPSVSSWILVVPTSDVQSSALPSEPSPTLPIAQMKGAVLGHPVTVHWSPPVEWLTPPGIKHSLYPGEDQPLTVLIEQQCSRGHWLLHEPSPAHLDVVVPILGLWGSENPAYPARIDVR